MLGCVVQVVRRFECESRLVSWLLHIERQRDGLVWSISASDVRPKIVSSS